jgi:hypothetical protein
LWKSLGAAYLHCIERYQSDARGGRAMRDRLPTVAGRALRSVAVQLKWLYLRYGHVEERGEIHLLLRAGAYAASRPVEMQVHKRYLLAPVALKESGEDYDWASFRIVRQL